MNKAEVAKMLTVAAGFDRRAVDPLTIEAWHQVPELATADYNAAVAVVIGHQTSPQAGEYFTVRHLVAGLRKVARSSAADIEADVRSAKARGLIPADWPKYQALDAYAASALRAARENDRAVALSYAPAELES